MNAGGMGIQFTFQMEPDAENIAIGLSKWAALIKDWRPIFTDIANLFRKHEKRHLKTEGAATGKKFEPLSEAYAAWKDRNFPGRPILVLRGTLREALTKKGAPGSLELLGRKRMVVGLNPGYRTPQGVLLSDYAHAHSQGDGVPARPPIRYDTKVHTAKLKETSMVGGVVPLGTAIAQIMQIHVVKARKQAFGPLDSTSALGHRTKIAAVFALRTK